MSRKLIILAVLLILQAVPSFAANYADGTYTVPFSMDGLGRHNVAHDTATAYVEDGKLYVDFTLERVDPRDHAPQYDWFQSSLGKVVPVADDASFTTSIKRLPVPNFGSVAVSAETSAMSQPYEIEYTMHVDDSNIPLKAEAEASEEAEEPEEPVVLVASSDNEGVYEAAGNTTAQEGEASSKDTVSDASTAEAVKSAAAEESEDGDKVLDEENTVAGDLAREEEESEDEESSGGFKMRPLYFLLGFMILTLIISIPQAFKKKK